MSKNENGKKGVNKKSSEDVRRRRPHESNRDRRIRQTAEAGFEIAKRRMAQLDHLSDECQAYLGLSDIDQRSQEVQDVLDNQDIRASELQRRVNKLMDEILDAELSIASESSIAEELLDERLASMRRLLAAQSKFPSGCQLFLDFKRARLRMRPKNWGTYETNFERTLYPDGRPIEYERGCLQVAKNHIEQVFKTSVTLAV